MDEKSIKLAIVGHTNTGKTSLMRTLTRDAEFGEVTPSPSTTRQVEGALLQVDGQTIVELYDTPGLEDAGSLIETLDQISAGRHDGPHRIQQFLAGDCANRRFEQEARVLTRVLDSTAALYVIDAREPVLGKYQDELAILALCARPVLPVLNFTASEDARSNEWREALARVNLHAVAEFDTMVFSIEAETKLWQRLISLLDQHGDCLQQLIHQRELQAEWQHHAAVRALAELLIDAAGCQRTAGKDDAIAQQQVSVALKQAITQHEQNAIAQLLSLYQFNAEDIELLELPIYDGRWHTDLFDPTALGFYAGRVGRGAGAGAAAGAAVDVATGGLSLGAGTVIGTLVGTGFGTSWAAGRNLLDSVRGLIRIQADDATLTFLAWRQIQLVRALSQRGHASVKPTRFADMPEDAKQQSIWPNDRLPSPLIKARLKPSVSLLNNEHSAGSSTRDRLVSELVETMSQMNTRKT
ncbi:MAG: GTPase/DUF3482 domain-containing protein [Pseudomonadota bacterium]